MHAGWAILCAMHPAVAQAPLAAARAPHRATLEEWLAIPEERRAELIDGRLIYQGMPGPVHGRSQGGIIALVRGPYDRRPGGADRPGGWWISMEVDMELAGMGCRPDVLGWRRDKHRTLPVPDEQQAGRRVVVGEPPRDGGIVVGCHGRSLYRRRDGHSARRRLGC